MTGHARWGYGLAPPGDSRQALRLALVAVPAGLVAGMLAGWMLSGRKVQAKFDCGDRRVLLGEEKADG